MSDVVLVLNSGSSSLKFSLFGAGDAMPLLARGSVSGIGTTPVFKAVDERSGSKSENKMADGSTHEEALAMLLRWIAGRPGGSELVAVGHRVVHGGGEFAAPVRVDPAVIARLKSFTHLAPLHQPHNLGAIEVIARLKPGILQVACFDTGFHAACEPLYTSYALPASLREKGVRRYGFHGLSYEWISARLRQDHPDLARGRVIAAHLGNGSSLCGMQDGKSVDSSMGFTALEGPPMGTRSGLIDPAVVIYCVRELGMTINAAEKLLVSESGLKGMSGISNDVKTLLESGDPRAKFAIEHYCFKVAQHAAALAVSLGGLDAFVFTAGIGEHAAPVREKVLDRLKFLGDFPVLVIPTNEERVIAQHVQDIAARAGDAPGGGAGDTAPEMDASVIAASQKPAPSSSLFNGA